MSSKANTVTHNLRSRPAFDVGGSYLQFTSSPVSSSRDRSPARSKSSGGSRSPARGSRSPARRRQSGGSRSPARSKPAEQVENSGSETKSLPKTPQKSPVRQSQRILERNLDKSPYIVLSDILHAELVEHGNIITTEDSLKPEIPGQPECNYQFEECLDLKPEPESEKDKEKSNVASGGIWSAMGIIISAALVFVLVILCSVKQFGLGMPNLSKQVDFYVDLQSLLMVTLWIVFQLLIALIPMGYVRMGQPLPEGGRLYYRCNGRLALLANVFYIGLLYYFEIPVFNWLTKKFVPVVVSAFVLTLCISLWLYHRASNLPQTQLSKCGETGCFFRDFYNGRELNPRLDNLDLKFFFTTNIGVIGWETLILLIVLEAYKKTLWTGNLLLVATFQSIYVLDYVLFQSCLVTTATVLYNGLGLHMVFASLLWQPFFSSIQVFDHLLNVKTMDFQTTALSALLFGAGYVIHRCSSYQKDMFRSNPHNALCSGFKIIPSGTGRPLLCTFWWSICRHPNYLGTLLMATGWSLPSGSPFSYALPLVMLLSLLFRIRSVESVCRKNHGIAWDKYTERVKSRLIPWIY